MHKIFTLFIITLFIFCDAGAQQVLFSENFDAIPGYNIPLWTQNSQATDPWQAGPPYVLGSYCFTPPGDNPQSGNKVMGFCDEHMDLNTGLCTKDNNEQLVFIYTPSISYIPGTWVQYDSYFLKAIVNGKTEKAEIVASGDGGLSWNVIQTVPQSNGPFSTSYAQVPYYVNATDLRIGFRYSDMGERMRGWMVDNVKVFVPAPKDLALTKVTPDDTLLRYTALNHFILLGGTVTNVGTDTVKNFVVKYQETGSAVMTDSISNVLIPPFTTYDFTHSATYTPTSAGKHSINMWVEYPGDNNTSNDLLTTDVRGVSFMPVKKLAAEVGTNVKNAWCPRSLYYMDSLKKMALAQDDDVSIIGIHTATDPMEDVPYATFIYYLHQYFLPYFLYDRRINADPDSFFSVFNKQKKYFGFADLDIKTTVSGSSVAATVTVNPAIDLKGDYRIVVVLTEDDVTGTASTYNQANIYAGGILGPMGGYENQPNPVSAIDMHYNFVARNIYPQADGQQGYLQSPLLAGNSYSTTYTIPLDAAWDISKLQAVALLLRTSDSTILNSNHTSAPLKVAGIPAVFNNVTLFPDPADETTRLEYDLKEPQDVHITLTDLTGKLLYQQDPGKMLPGAHETNIPVSTLSPGIYLVTISTPAGRQTIKLVTRH